MDTLNGCLIKILSFFGGLILLLAVAILAFQCFVYLLPWLIVFGALTVIVLGLCKGFWHWLTSL